MNQIVIGLGFGDEGKGAFVNYLCKKSKNSLVIRHSSGHQCGHSVHNNDIRHLFSNFGSGTLLYAPTYWSEYCTVNPMSLLKEGNALRELGINPILYINSNAMITTPYDILRNLKISELNLHGTVGVGFGTTIQRNEDYFHLYARDLQYPKIRDVKLKLLQEKYYQYVCQENSKTEKIIKEFLVACDELVSYYQIVDCLDNFLNYDWIFEGSQGIMLDQHYGFFPNVTRSNTTSKNAVEILNKYNRIPDETYYITRAYQTRHGNGYMSNEGMDISHIKSNPLEANTNDGWQGIFRKSVLDLDLLKYAIDCDKYHNPNSGKNIVITCLDQVPIKFPVTKNNKTYEIESSSIGRNLGIFEHKQFFSYSDEGVDL
jgi:adenylosuccinate synthase